MFSQSLLSLTLLTFASNSVFAAGPGAINLGTAANYVVFGKTGISTVPPSAITGAIAVTPAAGTAITGFTLTLDSTGTFSTSTQVVGRVYAASYVSPTPATLITAASNLNTAYNTAAGLTNPNFLNLNTGAIGGLILVPGLYKWTTGVSASSGFTIAGSATDTWVFQIAGTLSIAAAVRVTLVGGALPKNIVWVVASSVSFGAGSHFEGIVLGKTSITAVTGSSARGRLLAQTAVALQKATISSP